MFTTQQRVTRSPLSITARTDGPKIGNTTRHVSGKGKAVAFIDGPSPPPPPLGLLNDNGSNAAADGGDFDDWRAFKEAGLLDEATMERKDREAVAEKTARLEKELLDYQHNMGLLLIENKILSENAEELREALAETQEIIKREEAAHLMDVSEVEKRADNLKKALDLEKQCRVELEKALREVFEENKQIKLKSQTNLTDANTLMATIADKSKEVDEKMYEADAKLAEANRKSLELDRKMQEVETHESLLRTERQSFISGREAWEDKFTKQKEDLQEWERKLQEGEQRLCEGRQSMNLREVKVNEMERVFKQKEKEFEETLSKMESRVLESKKKEEDVNNRLLNLIAKEEKAEALKKSLEIKEKELLSLSEKLTAKEQVEIQKVLDTHKKALESKQREFDMEMEEKRKAFEDEMRKKVESIEKKEDEINHKEEKLKKLEQANENKMNRFIEKEKDLDTKLKALKENEKAFKSEAKKLETDKKQVLDDIETLQILKTNTDKIRNEIVQQESQVHEEIEKLRVTENERMEYNRLQLELKDEIEKCRHQKELIMKEVEDLRKDRMKFEGEWEALDEKRSVVSKEIREFEQQKEIWERVKRSEESKLENEKLSVKDFVKKETELLKSERESFESEMKNERTLLVEKAENERRQFVHEFEQKKRDLERELQITRTELEAKLKKRVDEFEKEREKEMGNISYLKEVVRKEMEELKSERFKLDIEKKEIRLKSQQLEESQLEMVKDIEELDVLTKRRKDQREEFMNERNRFLGFVEKIKSCGDCGEFIKSYELSEMQFAEGRDVISEKSEGILGMKDLKSPSGRIVSWIKKGATVFKMSPHRKTEDEESEIPEIPLGPIASQEKLLEASGSKVLEVPEGSEQQSEMTRGRRKAVRKPRKARPEASVSVNDGSPEVSRRKRSRVESSLVSGSEMDGGDDGESEVHSESVTTAGGGRRKRRQVVAPAVQTPGERRYNLRRHKTEDVNTEKKEVSGISETKKVTRKRDTKVASKDGSTAVVHVTTSKRVDTQILDTAVKTTGDFVVENTEIVEEVNVTTTCEDHNHQHNDDNDHNNDDDNEDDDDDDDDDDEQQVSIGKKIWTFLST